MDPNTTLRDIEDEIQMQAPPSSVVYKMCDDLREWLNKGGFEPNWDKYPIGSAFYRGLYHPKRSI